MVSKLEFFDPKKNAWLESIISPGKRTFFHVLNSSKEQFILVSCSIDNKSTIIAEAPDGSYVENERLIMPQDRFPNVLATLTEPSESYKVVTINELNQYIPYRISHELKK